MKFIRTTCAISACAAKRGRAGFTLVECLAAMMFMAIVIPVVMQALQVANRAGQVANRRVAAARIADSILQEELLTGQWQQGTREGTLIEGPYEYKWSVRNELWSQDAMKLVWTQVTFEVQGQQFDVRVCTLADNTL